MRNSIAKKIISVIAVIIMAITLIPAQAFAGIYYYTDPSVGTYFEQIPGKDSAGNNILLYHFGGTPAYCVDPYSEMYLGTWYETTPYWQSVVMGADTKYVQAAVSANSKNQLQQLDTKFAITTACTSGGKASGYVPIDNIYSHINGAYTTITIPSISLQWNSQTGIYEGSASVDTSYMRNETVLNNHLSSLSNQGLSMYAAGGRINVQATKSFVDTNFNGGTYTLPESSVQYNQSSNRNNPNSYANSKYIEGLVSTNQPSQSLVFMNYNLDYMDDGYQDNFKYSGFTLSAQKVNLNGSLTITKKSDDGIISGWRFTLSGNGNTYTATSDASGIARFTDIPAGTYTVTEQVDTSKYYDPGSYTVTIKENSESTITVQNRKRVTTGTVTVEKSSSDGVISGWVFTLSGTGGTFTATTNSSGKATFSNIPAGNYTLTETVDTSKYYDPGPLSLTVYEGGLTETTFHNVKRNTECTLTVQKEFHGGESPDNVLSGWTFDITGPGGYSTTKTTDASGYFELVGLQPGTYVITERERDATKWAATPATYNVTLVAGGITHVHASNERLVGGLVVRKTSADGNIAGITFVAEGPGGKFKAVTDEDGVAVFGIPQPDGTYMAYIPTGEYVVTEEYDPARYRDPGQQTAVISNTAYADLTFVNTPLSGSLTVHKSSEDGKLEGILFRLSGRAGMFTAVTDSHGVAKFTNIPMGTYTLTEEYDASRYQNPGSRTVEIDGYNEEPIEFNNLLLKGSLTVYKSSDDGEIEGKKFKISNSEYTDTQITDSHGIAFFPDVPAGVYTLEEVGETRYVPLKTEVTIREGVAHEIRATNRLVEEYLANLKIAKADLDTKKQDRIAGISLEGAKFDIINRTGNTVKVNGVIYSPDAIILTLVTDEDGNAETGKVLPIGRFGIMETEGPVGYNINPDEVTFEITQYGAEVSYELYEAVIRNDLLFKKITAEAHEGMADRVFRITLLDDAGDKVESHIAVTDAEGWFDSKSLLANSDKTNINKNDSAVNAYGEVDMSKIDSSCPVFFYGYHADETDYVGAYDRGAFVYGQYLIEELKTDDEYLLIDPVEVTMKGNEGFCHKYVFADYKTPVISTELVSSSGSKYVTPGNNITLIDKFTLSGIEEGRTYIVSGYLVDKETGEIAKDDYGEDIVAKDVTFKADAGFKQGELTYNFDGEDMGTKELVAFTTVSIKSELKYVDPTVILTDADIDNPDETISFSGPVISTYAHDGKGMQVVPRGEETTIVDTVTYENLRENTNYKLVGTIMDKETGEPFRGPTGEEYTVTKKFLAKESASSEDLTFIVDTTDYDGSELVVFEELYYNNDLIASHKDITDPSQTITIAAPEIATMATDEFGNKTVNASEAATIVDVVSYINLIPGKEYSLSAMLMDKSTGKVYKNPDGTEVRVTHPFTPEQTDGEEEVIFTADLTGFSGGELVAFERLYLDGILVASHEDINDEAQTVAVQDTYFLKIDAKSGETLEGAVIRVTDKTTSSINEYVSDSNGKIYVNLVPGHAYTYQEIAAPEGYKLDKSIYSFEVDEFGEPDIDLVIKNSKPGTVILTKTDALTGEPLEGVTLVVYDSNGKELFSQQTDKLGQIYFDATPFLAAEGSTTFKFKEREAPSGYYLNTDTMAFTVSSDGKATGTLKLENVPKGTIAIKKVDQNGALLPGAKFSIYSATDNKLLGQATTGTTGKIYFKAPSAGSYYFIEDAAPTGYVRDTQKHTFTIDASGNISGETSLKNVKGQSGSTGDEHNLPLTLALTAVLMGGACVMVYAAKRKPGKAQKGKHEA